MDDVLSKPLSVPALTAMIKKFWDTQDEEESTVAPDDNSNRKSYLIFQCWNNISNLLDRS